MAGEKKDPAFLFYVTAWLQSETVRSMTLEERGAFVELLSFAWLHGSIPANPEKLAAMLGVTRSKFAKLWASLAPCWGESADDPSRLINERQEHERSERRRKSEEAREKGSKGGKRSAESRAQAKPKPKQKPSRSGSRAQAEGVAKPKPSTPTSTASGTTPTPPPEGGASRSQAGGEAEQQADGQAEADPVVQLQLALSRTRVRSKMKAFDRSRELLRIAQEWHPRGLTPDDVAELDRIDARDNTEGRGSLLGTWLRDNACLMVLDEERGRKKERWIRARSRDGDAARGDPKPAASVVGDVLSRARGA